MELSCLFVGREIGGDRESVTADLSRLEQYLPVQKW